MFTLQAFTSTSAGSAFVRYEIDTAGKEEVLNLVNTLNQKMKKEVVLGAGPGMYMCIYLIHVLYV